MYRYHYNEPRPFYPYPPYQGQNFPPLNQQQHFQPHLMQQQYSPQQQMFSNPFYQQMSGPPPRPIPRPPSNGFFGHFQKDNGQLDFEKMFSTANQFGNTIKQFGPLLKMFTGR